MRRKLCLFLFFVFVWAQPCTQCSGGVSLVIEATVEHRLVSSEMRRLCSVQGHESSS